MGAEVMTWILSLSLAFLVGMAFYSYGQRRYFDGRLDELDALEEKVKDRDRKLEVVLEEHNEKAKELVLEAARQAEHYKTALEKIASGLLGGEQCKAFARQELDSWKKA